MDFTNQPCGKTKSVFLYFLYIVRIRSARTLSEYRQFFSFSFLCRTRKMAGRWLADGLTAAIADLTIMELRALSLFSSFGMVFRDNTSQDRTKRYVYVNVKIARYYRDK